jgi:predicted metal-dependent phosphoesterase TrpH
MAAENTLTFIVRNGESLEEVLQKIWEMGEKVILEHKLLRIDITHPKVT